MSAIVDQNEYRRRVRQDRRESGLCPHCGRSREKGSQWVACASCREKHRTITKARLEKQANEVRCARCGHEKPQDNFATCTTCRRKMRERKARLRVEDARLEQMLLGSFVYQLDKKGRVVVPAPMRALAGKRFFLCRLPEQRAALVAGDVYRALLESQQREYWLLGAVEVQADPSTGRIQIPHWLRDYLGILPQQEVVWVGIEHALTLQSWSRWDASQRQRDEQMRRYLSILAM